MNSLISDIVQSNKDMIVQRSLEKMELVRKENYLESISDVIYENTNKEFIEIVVCKFDHEHTLQELNRFTERLIKLGWPLSYLTQGLHAFRKSVIEAILQEEEINNNFELFLEIENWVDGLVNELVAKYSGSWEQTVTLQKMALKELSAPLIPVFENISVMPLIGTIDTERAKLIMENLLNGVIEHRSEVVLIDITGVPVVDTMVAHHIIQASEAVRLVGAQSILVGIRPEIAQTIVHLGIDLGNFPTKSTLRKGIEAALMMTNKKIMNIDS